VNWATIETHGAYFTESHLSTADEAATLVIGKFFFTQLAGVQLGWA